jgi:hypothetical protein
VPLNCPEGRYREQLREFLEEQARERERKYERDRKRRYRAVREREAYIISCAFSGSSRASDLRMLTAHVILKRLHPQVMATLTFPERTGEDRRRQETLAFLRRWWPEGKWVVAFERHRSGRLHAHALAETPGREVRRLSMMDAWQVDTGGYARVEQVRDQEQAAAYIGKYIVKEEDGELQFGEGLA